MHDKTKAEPWTWTPADSSSRRQGRMLGAIVLAVMFFTAGVVIGRMSVVDLAPLAENKLPAEVELSWTPAPQPPPVRASNSAERQPIMALKSETAPEEQGKSAAISPPNPAVLINPGTVSTRDFTAEKAMGALPAIRRPTIMVDPSAPKSKHENAENNPSGGLSPRVRSKRELAKSQSARPTEQSALSTPPPSVRDYQDLRAYMLAR